MAVILGIILVLAGLFEAASGLSIGGGAETIYQQIYGGIETLTGAVLVTGGSILAALGAQTDSSSRATYKLTGEVQGLKESLAREVQALRVAVPADRDARKAKPERMCKACGFINPPEETVCRCGIRL